MNSTAYRCIRRSVVASIATLAAATLTAISGCAPKHVAPLVSRPTAANRSQQIAFLQQQLIVLQNDQKMPADQKARVQQSLQQEILGLSSQTTP